jgi:Ca2+-binding RTX toxin-like protein
MIRRVLPVLVVAGLTVVPAAQGAAASDVTCHGVPATIVATSGGVLGTPGDDVIVISGMVAAVDAGAGADLICVVGVDGAAIRADTGDDTVDTTRNGTLPSWTTLGLGTNTFVGGPGEDRVDLGGAPESPSSDTVDTGAGEDVVNVGGASAWLAVRTGGGADTLGWGDDLPPGSFDLQGGANKIRVEAPNFNGGTQAVAVDLSQHTIRVNGVTTMWRGRVAEVFASGKRVDVLGDDRSDELVVDGCHVTMRGRGGDDRLTMVGNRVIYGMRTCHQPRASRQFGGAGNDVLSGLGGPDLLVGGGGVDTAYGLMGRDACEAERQRGCET